MIANLVLSPPIAFPVLLLACGLLYMGLGGLTLKKKGFVEGLTKPYACGEEQIDVVQTDYGQFLPFAFFFTILHVVALMVTSVPIDTLGSYLIAVLYLLGALAGLSILYRS